MSERRAFFAGFLWMNFKMKWSPTEKDLDDAQAAYGEWCDHLEKKGEVVNRELSEEMKAAVRLGVVTEAEAKRMR